VFLKNCLSKIWVARRAAELALDPERLKNQEQVWTSAQGLRTNHIWPTKELSLRSHHAQTSLRNQSSHKKKDTEKNMTLDDCRGKTIQQIVPAASDQPVRSSC